jgi:hypothetical protein
MKAMPAYRLLIFCLLRPFHLFRLAQPCPTPLPSRIPVLLPFADDVMSDTGVQGTVKTAAKTLASTAVPPPGYLDHLKVSFSRKDDPTAKVSELL